jgi:muconolactone delta-isomerase
MRVCILVEPKFPAPPEMAPAMLQGFAAWREKWRPKMKVFEFWAGRGGGMGIAEVANETELSQMMMEWPMAQFSDVDVRPIVDGDEALKRLTATMQEMMANMAKAQPAK